MSFEDCEGTQDVFNPFTANPRYFLRSKGIRANHKYIDFQFIEFVLHANCKYMRSICVMND
jgi:hypothetical protein